MNDYKLLELVPEMSFEFQLKNFNSLEVVVPCILTLNLVMQISLLKVHMN